MIVPFACSETERIFQRQRSHRLPGDIQRINLRKLLIIHAATSLYDLRVPPGNHLERLAGARLGQYSIRVNAQWRICFHWRDANAYAVEAVDYH